MKCQNCGKNDAVFHYTILVNGKKIERMLCPSCAKQLGYELPWQDGLSFDPVFASFLEERPTPEEEKAVCPQCGSTWREIKESGKVGCQTCYKVFEPLLSPYIRKIHGDAVHKGKLPEANQKDATLHRKKERLQAELNAAIQDQRYEAAAVLRDEIRALEKEAQAKEAQA